MKHPIIVEWHDHNKKIIHRRHYKRLDTAIPAMTKLALLEALPKTVITFSHAVTGLELGHIKVRTWGRLDTEWIWDRELAKSC